MSSCPLTVTKCQRSDFTGRVNEIPYVAYEVRGIRTIACGLRFKKRPEKNPPKPWWATGGWDPVPAPRGSAEDLLGLVPAQIRLGELEQLAPGSPRCRAAEKEVERLKGLVVEAWKRDGTIDDAMTSRWWTKPESYGQSLVSMKAEDGLRLLGLSEEMIAHLVQRAKEWDAIPAVEKTGDNPFGNPPVTCEHCKKDIRWPDRESCEKCGGFTCGCVCSL